MEIHRSQPDKGAIANCNYSIPKSKDMQASKGPAECDKLWFVVAAREIMHFFKFTKYSGKNPTQTQLMRTDLILLLLFVL